MVNAQFAFLRGEGGVLSLPTDFRPLPGDDRPFLRGKKPLVLLERAIGAMPGISPLALGDSIKTIEYSAMMR